MQPGGKVPCPGLIITTQGCPWMGLSSSHLLDMWEMWTQVTIKLQPLQRKKKIKMFSPSQIRDFPRAGYQIPFLKRNSEESASSQKTSTARKVNNYKEGQHLSLAILPSLLLLCWRFLENTLKGLRWSKQKEWPTQEMLSFNITCLFSPTKPKREVCLKGRECLLNQLKMHSLLRYSLQLSWNQTLLPLDHKIEVIWNENISCPLLASF